MSKISEALQKALEERKKAEGKGQSPAVEITPLADVPAEVRNMLKKYIVFLNNDTQEALVTQEAFRVFRTNLKVALGKRKSILITSADDGEGKSFIALNLGVAMAQVGERVLLVDVNVHNPQLAEMLGMDNIPGLMEILSVGSSWEDIVQKTPVPNLELIPCGYPLQNHSEVLSSPAMAELLKEWEKAYDVVIIDAGSISTDSDALVIAPKVKGVILVARLNKSKKEALVEAKSSLLQVDAKILGYVTTEVFDVIPRFLSKYIS